MVICGRSEFCIWDKLFHKGFFSYLSFSWVQKSPCTIAQKNPWMVNSVIDRKQTEYLTVQSNIQPLMPHNTPVKISSLILSKLYLDQTNCTLHQASLSWKEGRERGEIVCITAFSRSGSAWQWLTGWRGRGIGEIVWITAEQSTADSCAATRETPNHKLDYLQW